ncbi:MAG: mobile mystery protein B [Myxococcaceae bacterium]
MTTKPLHIQHAAGATPLDPNEVMGLIPTHIATQGELNEVEQRNILRARAWAIGRAHRDLLSEAFLRNLHRRMFEDVWRWAGQYRTTDKSIGVHPEHIREELQKLFANVAHWIQHHTYPWVELAVRFHHKLVSIHPFVNGNGRHSRLMTDLLLEAHRQPAFTWGESLARAHYIEALKAADERRYAPLIAFVQK